MSNLNYIIHLNSVFENFARDSRLNPTHISMYMAIFQLANNFHFPPEFYINRTEVMSLAKIGSLNTYHKCIKELDHYKYIIYKPSYNRFKGSLIILLKFDTGSAQVENRNNTSSVQELRPKRKQYTNPNKLYKPYKIKKEDVISFFKNQDALKKVPEKKCECLAVKFFNFYESIGWKTAGNPITNWKAAAENWIEKAKLPQKNTNSYLHAADNAEKNYNQPL